MRSNSLSTAKLFLFVVTFALIQNVNAQFSQWSYLATGLQIRRIAPQGDYLWIATESGVVELNKTTGQKIIFDKTNSGLRSNYINFIYIDRTGNKWIATRETGLYKYNGTSWENFTTSNSPLPDDNVQAIVQDTVGRMWFGTYSGGLAKLHNSTWTIYDTLNTNAPVQYIWSLAYDNYGYLWIGTDGSGILRFDCENEWVNFNTSNNNVLLSDVVKAIAVDQNGYKWFGTESGDGGGLYKFDGSMFTLYSTGSFSLNIYAIDFDIDGKLWAASYGGGLARLEGTSWTVYNTGNSGIPSNGLRSLYIDPSGTKWIGTEYKGLAKFTGSSWTTYNLGILPNNYVFSMVKDKNGTKWIGTKNFLTKYQNGAVESIDLTDFLINPTPALPPNFNVWSIAFDAAGNRWIGTYDGGLVRLTPTNVPKVYNTVNSNIPSDNVYSVVVDQNDVKWVGTSNGLAKFDGTTWYTYKTSNSQLPNNYITCLAIDKQKKLWITTTNGVAKFDGVNWTVYSTSNGLPGNYANYVAVDSSNNKWIATGSGLAKFNGSTWTVYNSANGLPSDVVHYVACDSIGGIWAGVGGFVMGAGLAHFDGNSWEIYNSSNSGLAGNEVSGFFIDEQGTRWIGTFDNGVSLYHPNSGPVGTLTLLTPRTGSTLVAGTGYNITWTSANVNNIKLEYSTDGGTNWNVIIGSTPAAAESYNWTVPNTLSVNCKIKISDVAAPSVAAISGSFTIASSFCRDVSFTSNWNILSVPVKASNMNSAVLFPTSTSSAYSYNSITGYAVQDTLQTGKGYWLRFPAAGIRNICGSPSPVNTVSVSAGWNLIGVYDYDVAVDSITTIPPGIRTSPFYAYSGGYQLPSVLNTGKGYWVRTSAAGVMTMPSGVKIKGGERLGIRKEQDEGKLIFSDAEGHSVSLYLNRNAEQSSFYELPPIPPAGIFDIRFASQRIAEDIKMPSHGILFNGVVYPLTIHAEGVSFIIMDKVTEGKIMKASLSSGESLQINNPAVSAITAEVLETTKEFQLMQNYPNPFNPSTAFRFAIPNKSLVQLKLYNQLGEVVSVIANEEMEAGLHTINWSAEKLASGVYYYKLTAGSFTSVRKLMLIK